MSRDDQPDDDLTDLADFIEQLLWICGELPPVTPKVTGRRPVSLARVVFAVILRARLGASARKLVQFLRELEPDLGTKLSGSVPSHNSLLLYLGEGSCTPITSLLQTIDDGVARWLRSAETIFGHEPGRSVLPVAPKSKSKPPRTGSVQNDAVAYSIASNLCLIQRIVSAAAKRDGYCGGGTVHSALARLESQGLIVHKAGLFQACVGSAADA